MNVNVRQSGDVTILDLKGRLTVGSSEVLRNSLHGVVSGGARKVVVNLHDVSMIDSSGVGELLSARTTATHRGARVNLAELPARVADILTISQLSSVFDMYDDVDEAVRSFA